MIDNIYVIVGDIGTSDAFYVVAYAWKDAADYQCEKMNRVESDETEYTVIKLPFGAQ